jgi:hypothetical protein
MYNDLTHPINKNHHGQRKQRTKKGKEETKER